MLSTPNTLAAPALRAVPQLQTHFKWPHQQFEPHNMLRRTAGHKSQELEAQVVQCLITAGNL